MAAPRGRLRPSGARESPLFWGGCFNQDIFQRSKTSRPSLAYYIIRMYLALIHQYRVAAVVQPWDHCRSSMRASAQKPCIDCAVVVLGGSSSFVKNTHQDEQQDQVNVKNIHCNRHHLHLHIRHQHRHRSSMYRVRGGGDGGGANGDIIQRWWTMVVVPLWCFCFHVKCAIQLCIDCAVVVLMSGNSILNVKVRYSFALIVPLFLMVGNSSFVNNSHQDE